ncbi:MULTISPECIES: LytTR family DNA-binding domain-containing protein [Lacrimispora]|jgi:DNA-binding LytR/AlgR family response regulator|uniref:LytTR family DNA-binding domain-containing protein n=1 Tax=Lacrimispora TaxID=2719231 RepID=UPI000BE2A603|nr:LytTR family DNA-binding domain-containing protein [Lacrimispora amygdalina]MDK2967483.1 hypothetical protein [Lacrimispora sp.]
MSIAFLIDDKTDLIVLYPKIRSMVNLEKMKYSAIFNGKFFALTIREIYYLESYDRKASLVLKEGRIRIKARLNEEERKLPKEWFVRISRHNIINMHHVRSVNDEKVEIINGDILYVSHNRKKMFQKEYRLFLEFYNRLV